VTDGLGRPLILHDTGVWAPEPPAPELRPCAACGGEGTDLLHDVNEALADRPGYWVICSPRRATRGRCTHAGPRAATAAAAAEAWNAEPGRTP
jgi:hypothetical protein